MESKGQRSIMINSFKDYLVEEEKTTFFTFGRMNPPTLGHEKLLDALASKAGKNPYKVFLSQSQDAKKNPLDFKSKVKFARKMFPKHARQIMADNNMRNVMEIASKLYDEGNRKIVMVVGSDRVNEFDVLLNKYNGVKGRHGFYNFQSIKTMSAGERDPDAEGVSGMSASKMRAAASEKDFTSFSQGLPRKTSNADAKAIYNAVRKGLGLKEQTDFRNHFELKAVSGQREEFIEGMFQPGDTVVVKENDQIGTVVQRGANFLVIEMNGKQYRKWLHDVEILENKKDKDYVPGVPGVQPKGQKDYYKGVGKDKKQARAAQFKRQSAKSDDDPSAYKDAPGDKKARETGKVKTSKHTKKFHQMFGDK